MEKRLGAPARLQPGTVTHTHAHTHTLTHSHTRTFMHTQTHTRAHTHTHTHTHTPPHTPHTHQDTHTHTHTHTQTSSPLLPDNGSHASPNSLNYISSQAERLSNQGADIDGFAGAQL